MWNLQRKRNNKRDNKSGHGARITYNLKEKTLGEKIFDVIVIVVLETILFIIIGHLI